MFKKYQKMHCVKSVHIRSFSGPHCPTFGLNTEEYSVSLRIQPKCWKIRTRKTPNTDTFHIVMTSILVKSTHFMPVVSFNVLGGIERF